MNNPPTGTITFLFTDIEGSTSRWEQDAAQMSAALARHDSIMREAIQAHDGYIFKTMGDAFYAAFRTAANALAATIDIQRCLNSQGCPTLAEEEAPVVRVRMALHTGAAEERDGDYFGQPLNRVARLMAAGHGGQILLSQPTYELVRDHMPPMVTMRDMGEHRLKDLIRPEHIYQVVLEDIQSEFPILKTLDNRPNNLPAQPTPLIGREKELDSLERLLRRADVRLVTFTGPGGTGKTRLALQLAADLLDDFPDGVWLVDLAPITDADLVLSTIARALGVQEAAGQSLLETLKAYLKNRRLLLVLDNFEQIIEAATHVGLLLAGCSGIKVLATSRIALRLRGEHEFAVPPLPLPDPQHLPLLEYLTQYDAVRLFIERALAVKSDFTVDNYNAPAVAEICVRLDGLPLAIELAAARIKILPPKAMLSRLQTSLKLLTGGAIDLPARQQTLRGAIQWSYDLLDEGEKQFFRRIAVFQGGRTFEAMETVCNFDRKLEMDVLDSVQSLVSKNLLQQREGSDGQSGEPRFWMLETIHEYAREKLDESTDSEAIKREHALYFMRMAEAAWPNLGAPLEAKWIARLEVDYDNIRAALRWAKESNEIEIGLRIVGALVQFWTVHGHMAEGWEQANDLFRLAGKDGCGTWASHRAATLPMAKALSGAGMVVWLRGDYPTARHLIEQGLSMHRELGDKTGIAMSLRWLSNVVGAVGDPVLAYSLLEQSLAIFKELNNKVGRATVLQGMGNWESIQGDYAKAHLLHEESLSLFREAGDRWGAAIELLNLGQVVRVEGDYERAQELFTQGLLMSKEFEDKRAIAGFLLGFGGLAGATKQPVKAASILGASEAVRETIGFAIEPEDKIEYDRDLAIIRSQLDDETFAKAWAEGQAMSMEQAIAYTLDAIWKP